MNENEPKPEPGAEVPDGLSPEARGYWPKIAEQLTDCGILTRIDAMALALYCEAYATWRKANENVVKYGAVIKYPGTELMVQSPYLAVSNKAHHQMVTLLREFGMTPSSRTRVSATPTKPQVNRLHSVLNGGKRRA